MYITHNVSHFDPKQTNVDYTDIVCFAKYVLRFCP